MIYLQNHQTTLLSLLFAMVSLFFFFGSCRAGKSAVTQRSKSILILIVVLFLGVRLGLSGMVTQLSADTQTFKAWAIGVCSLGVGGLYRSGMMVDYPPVYLHILGIVGCVTKFLNISFDHPIFPVTLSAIPTLCDLALAFLATRFLRFENEEFVWNTKTVCMLMGLFLLPHAVTNSTLFGQMDSVPYLILAVSLYFIVPRSAETVRSRQLCLSSVLFGIALLTKPIVILFAPLGFLYACFFWSAKNIFLAGVCFVITVLFILFSSANFDVALLSKIAIQYQTTLGSYPYASLNAANMYALLGWNWVDVKSIAFAGLTIAQLGKTLLIASVVAGCAFAFWDIKKKHYFTNRMESVFYCSGAYLMLIFTFSDQMHERYLFGAGTFFALAYVCVTQSHRLDEAKLYLPKRSGRAKFAMAAGVVTIISLNQSLFLDFHRLTSGYHVPAATPWLMVLSFVQIVTMVLVITFRVKENSYETP